MQSERACVGENTEGTAIRKSPVESWEDHVEAWHHLNRQVDDAAWSKAALIVSVRERFDKGGKTDAIKKFAEDIHCHWGSLYRLARTFDAFPADLHRCKSLTFTHHLMAVELTDNTGEAREAAALAEREGWSAGALRAYLKPPELPAAAAEDATCATEPGSCGPITDSDRVLHIWAFVENFYAVKDYNAKSLVDQSTKKSAKELLQKINQIQEWFTTMQAAIEERIG